MRAFADQLAAAKEEQVSKRKDKKKKLAADDKRDVDTADMEDSNL
jgi:hypothetical protein